MPPQDADWDRARSRSHPTSLPFRRARTAGAGLLALGVACTLLIACGDDGTEGLSSCPDYKIVLNKNDELVCAPVEKKTGVAGSAAKTSASTASTSQANTGTKPAASSSAAAAANSGSAGGTPALPMGPGAAFR